MAWPSSLAIMSTLQAALPEAEPRHDAGQGVQINVGVCRSI